MLAGDLGQGLVLVQSPEEAGWALPLPFPSWCLFMHPAVISWGVDRSPAPYMGSWKGVEGWGATVALCLLLAPGNHSNDRTEKGGPFGDGGEE